MTDQIVIDEGTTTVEVLTSGDVLELVDEGPAGGPGPPGPPGPAAGILFTQVAPLPVWTINHNLGYRPDVSVLDAGSNEVEAEVQHPTVNQTVVTFDVPMAGSARLV